MVIGSRFLGENGYKGSKERNVGNIIFSKLISALIGLEITDATSGFRAFNGSVADEVKIKSTVTYTYEQVIRAVRQGKRVCDVPVGARLTRKSKLFKNPLEYALRSGMDILKIYCE